MLPVLGNGVDPACVLGRRDGGGGKVRGAETAPVSRTVDWFEYRRPALDEAQAERRGFYATWERHLMW